MNNKYLPDTTKEELQLIRDLYEERAAILEYDAGYERSTANNMAAEAMGYLNAEALEYFLRVREEEIAFEASF